MRLRSHTNRASSLKGKDKIVCEGSSDDGGGGKLSSDSDYYEMSEPGEDFSILEDNKESEDDNDFLDMVPKKRKSSSSKNMGSQSCEEDDAEQINRDNESEISRAVELDLIRALEENDGKKNKRKRNRKADKPVLMWQVLEQENEKWIAENLETDLNFKNPNELMTETIEPSDDLTVTLLRYQKEWLAWALKQENSVLSGGILADEMGMGKTLQAISLVLLKRHLLGGIHVDQVPSSSACPSEKLPAIRGTLVICPLVAVMQWVSEIERFTLERSTKVLVYHGANRTKNVYQFSEYDFVITTYSIVEAEYRKHIMTPKERCQYCGKLFHGNKLKIHLKYTCGPFANKTAKQSKQQKKEPTAKKIADLVEKLKKCDQDKGSAKDRFVSSMKKSILHSVIWERIILDEAHYIKERRSNTTRAIISLQSSYRWALSGTPLQNRVGELYSLVRFLRIVPYSYYFCKDCDCRVLDYSSSAECPSCPHKGVRHFCWWNRYIASPIKDQGNAGSGREAMFLLKHKILKNIVLRRTKKERAADLALPPRIVTLRRDSLDVVEEDYYTALYNDSRAKFDRYIEAGTLLNNYAHIFDLLTRLRQAVDHPYLVEYSITLMERKGRAVDTGNREMCGLCHEMEEDSVVTSCGHFFCKSCLIDFGSTMGQSSCPTCSKPLTVDFTAIKFGKEHNLKATVKGFRPSSILNRIQLDNFQTSTKIDALREEIRFMVERDGSAKGLVFSQFSSFLDLIHYTLQKCGVKCVQLDGSMSMADRDAAIKRFSEDPDCRIFLMGLKAGGVALNLTAASHVFLMDPWWNPAVERQAQDRIHRIGQYKPIRIVRFVIVNSIEERILKLQEKKELVFEGTVGGSSEALAKLTEADLKFLFVI